MARTEQEELADFCETFQEEIRVKASPEEGVLLFQEEAFTLLLLERLEQVGELDEPDARRHESRGMKVDGYALDIQEGRLDVVGALYRGATTPETVTRTEINQALRRMAAFVEGALKGLHKSLEEAAPAFEMARRIHEHRESIVHVGFFVLTDGIYDGQPPDVPPVGALQTRADVWDLRRVYRLESSGREREKLKVDFEEFGGPIPCLGRENSDYHAYVAIVPGLVLAKIYERFGPQLLERNVRSYLQLRGKINKGMQSTITDSPGRFLAYNNGIAITADELVLRREPDGSMSIRSLRDFQIVNGGQTTATIYHTWARGKADLADVHVLAKISIVDGAVVDELVPLISRYANSQNKISDTDFWANDPFHVALQKMSRTVWAPRTVHSPRETRWFYERARGQYVDALGRCPTKASRKKFQDDHPVGQKFTKTDLAKFINTWDCLPHDVSFGSEKNFLRFNKRVKADVDKGYFQIVVAQAIVFRTAEKVVAARKFPAHKNLIVTYTIAWLRRHHPELFDVDLIWKTQSVPTSLRTALDKVCVRVRDEILATAGGRNVGEWCKKEECWKAIERLNIALSGEITRTPSAPHLRDQERFNVRDAALWLDLMEWCSARSDFEPWVGSRLFEVAQAKTEGRAVSGAHIRDALDTLDRALALGFVEASAQ